MKTERFHSTLLILCLSSFNPTTLTYLPTQPYPSFLWCTIGWIVGGWDLTSGYSVRGPTVEGLYPRHILTVCWSLLVLQWMLLMQGVGDLNMSRLYGMEPFLGAGYPQGPRCQSIHFTTSPSNQSYPSLLPHYSPSLLSTAATCHEYLHVSSRSLKIEKKCKKI